MGLNDTLTQDLKTAMKTGDTTRRETIRALRGAIKNEEIDKGQPLSEEEVLAVLIKQAKQRRDSIEQFTAAQRLDLVAGEAAELEIIEAYLPRQLSDEEITLRAQALIEQLGATDMKSMGAVMGRLTQELKGVADGKRISAIVRQLLSA